MDRTAPTFSKPGPQDLGLDRRLGLVLVAIECLIVTPDARPQNAGKFTARLESIGEAVITGTRQPLVDGSRALLNRGFDPATLLTMRMHDRAYDRFVPAPIGELAQWTYSESEAHPLKRRLWTPRKMPIAVDRAGQKWGIAAMAGPTPGTVAKIALRRPAPRQMAGAR